jgi:hypothetical protein
LVLGFNGAAYLQNHNWQCLPPEEVEEYKRVFTGPGSLTGPLNWYRAFEFNSHDPLDKITQPALFIWGAEDGAFGRVAANKTSNYVEGPYRQHSLKAGHKLMVEAPDQVADAVLSHLRSLPKLSKQWSAASVTSGQDDASACDQSRPHCLNIIVAPDGKSVRIRNKCDARHTGGAHILHRLGTGRLRRVPFRSWSQGRHGPAEKRLLCRRVLLPPPPLRVTDPIATSRA